MTLFLCFSNIAVGQDSLKVIQSKEERILMDIKTERRCDIHALESIFFHYLQQNNKEELNKFCTLIYENEPEKLDFNFHQEIVNLSFKFNGYFNEQNKSSSDYYYRSLRFRFTKAKEQQQQILLAKAEFYFRKGQIENAYSRLSEVLKIKDATYRSLKEDKGFPSSSLSYEYAYQAYILLLKHLPVDDIRFKMLVKNSRYRKYINHNDQYPYQIINEKLSKAGYEEVQPGTMPGEKSIIPIEELQKKREKANREEEEFKKKYEWKKKE